MVFAVESSIELDLQQGRFALRYGACSPICPTRQSMNLQSRKDYPRNTKMHKDGKLKVGGRRREVVSRNNAGMEGGGKEEPRGGIELQA